MYCTLHTKLQICSYIPYTLQFFSQLQRFFSSFIYIDKDFHNDYFRKIFAVFCVVCKGLNSEGKTDSQISEIPPNSAFSFVILLFTNI